MLEPLITKIDTMSTVAYLENKGYGPLVKTFETFKKRTKLYNNLITYTEKDTARFFSDVVDNYLSLPILILPYFVSMKERNEVINNLPKEHLRIVKSSASKKGKQANIIAALYLLREASPLKELGSGVENCFNLFDWKEGIKKQTFLLDHTEAFRKELFRLLFSLGVVS